MASQKDLWDAIVIGAGIQGCFTAYHLAKHGKQVLLLEQVLYPLYTPDLRDCPCLLPQREVSRASRLWGQARTDHHKFCAMCSLAAWCVP